MKILNQFKLFARFQRRLGRFAGLKWYLIYRVNRMRMLPWRSISIRPRNLERPISVRIQNSSDVDVFNQIFVGGEVDYLNQLGDIRTVIDLGANVGYFSAMVLSTFPRARVVAVEPDPENAALCRKNLAAYGLRATVIEGAAWRSDKGLVLSRGTFRDGREWATEVREAMPGEPTDLQGWGMAAILKTAGFGFIDLLKIDIEGSERELFKCDTEDWLGRTRNISIEIHGEDCGRVVTDALKPFGYELLSSGEYTLLKGLQLERAEDSAACELEGGTPEEIPIASAD